MQSLYQEMTDRIINLEDSMGRQVEETNQKIIKMESRLENANTVPATGGDNLPDRIGNLEKLVGDLTTGRVGQLEADNQNLNKEVVTFTERLTRLEEDRAKPKPDSF